METLGKLILCLLVALLVGCTNDEKLTRQVRDLQIQVNDLKAQLKESIENREYLETQAGVYQGCMWGINVCSEQMLVNGELAISKGLGGGSSPWFWVIVGAKVLVIALVISLILLMTGVAVLRFGIPAIEETDQARKLIFDAERRAQEADQKTRAAVEQLAPAQTKLAQIQAEIVEAESRLAEVRARESQDLASLQAAKKALDLF